MPRTSSRLPPVDKTSSRNVILVDGGGEARVQPSRERLRQAKQAGRDAVVDVVTEVEVRPGVVERTTTKRVQDVLSMLLAQGAIGVEQHACGQVLFKHWQKSGLDSSGVVDLLRERVDGGTHKPESEERLHHLSKWSKIMSGLGYIHADVIRACVLEGASLVDYGLRSGPYRNARQAREWATARMTAALSQLVINLLGPRHVRGRAEMAADARPGLPVGSPARREVEIPARSGRSGGPEKSD